MSNSRKYTRLDCSVPVDGKEGSVFEETQTTDISKGGIGFVSSKRIPLNKKIPIELNLGESDDPVFVIGRVKWTRSIPDSDNYRVGLIFEDVLRGSKSRLNKYFSEAK